MMAFPVIDDLKQGPSNSGPMTVDRAFTICELIALRRREGETEGSAVWNVSTQIARAIREVANTWIRP